MLLVDRPGYRCLTGQVGQPFPGRRRSQVFAADVRESFEAGSSPVARSVREVQALEFVLLEAHRRFSLTREHARSLSRRCA